MKKYNELLKNVGLLTISNFGSKLLAFFLLPIYTAVLSTSDYGNFDYINVTVSLLVPLLTLNISEAGLRFLLDIKNDDNKKNIICSVTFKYCIYSMIVVIIACIFNNYICFSSIIKEYTIYFILYYFSNLIYQTMQNIVRGYDRLKNIAVSGIINSILTLFLNIIFLLYIKMGLQGYFLAYIISMCISSFYLILVLKPKMSYKSDKKIERNMISYSGPLMLNSLGWWINNVSDRYFVTYMCGLSENGIYSIAYKIPSLLSIFQTIFNQAWTISSVKHLNKNDNGAFFQNVYSVYNFLMIIICSMLIILSKILSKILYRNEFYYAWKYMPFLLISIVFGALSGVIGGIFTATKDSKILGITTFIGAIINIFLNYVFITAFGTIGAALSTMISYFVVWISRVLFLRLKLKIYIHIIGDLFSYFLLIVQSILLIINIKYVYIVEILIILIIVLMNIRVFKRTLIKEEISNENCV